MCRPCHSVLPCHRLKEVTLSGHEWDVLKWSPSLPSLQLLFSALSHRVRKLSIGIPWVFSRGCHRAAPTGERASLSGWVESLVIVSPKFPRGFQCANRVEGHCHCSFQETAGVLVAGIGAPSYLESICVLMHAIMSLQLNGSHDSSSTARK